MAASARIEELKKRYEENQRRFFAPLANEYRKAGDLEQAIALCRVHLAEAPNNISGQIVFAQALFDAGTLDESRTAFETAIGLDPENLIALRHLGDIARTNRDFPTARQWYQRVLDADRRNEEVLALMEELNTLELSPPEGAAEQGDPGAAGGESPADAAPAQAIAQSPVSSAASLTGGAPNLGSTTPTVEVVARRAPPAAEPTPVPAPEPEPVAPPEPIVAAAPEPAVADDIGFEAPAPEPPAAPSAPDSSFGFDVDLDAASQLPSYADDTTSEFGVVELPVVSAFSEVEPDPAPGHLEPIEMAYDATVEATLEGSAESAGDAPGAVPAEALVEEQAAEPPAAEMSSVLEYIEEAPAAAVPDAPAGEELLDFELETPAPPAPVPEPAFDSFELTTESESDAGAAAATGEEEPAPGRRASLESFDPIREMPTPIAPMATARKRTPQASEPPEPSAEPLPAAPPQPSAPQEAFATETMAELYVQQGLRQEAIAVYRQLVAARPDDAGLRARLAELTGATRKPGGSTARAFFANLAGRRATPNRPAVVADPPAPRTPTPMPQPVIEAAAIEPVAEVAEPVAEAIGAPPLPPDVSLIELEPEPPAVAAAEAAAEPDSVAMTASASDDEPASEPASEPVSEPAAGGTLDALFGHTSVATPDNGAAQTLAAAFSSKPTPPAGRPTRAASDEFSLDRVFRQESSTPSKGGLSVPRQSKSLRFDQFFTPPADGAADAPAKPPADAGDESEQFQSWLSRLKKP